MGIVKKLKKGAKKVGKTAKKGAKKVGKTAKKGAKKVGKTVKGGAKKVKRTTIKTVKTVQGRGIRIVKNTIEGEIKNQVNLIKTIKNIAKDVKKKYQKDFFRGMLELGKSPLEIIEAAAKAGAGTLGITFANLIELWGGHPLSPEQKREARKIFGKSLPLNDIQIAYGGLAKEIEKINKKRPFVALRLICYKSKRHVANEGMRTFIHELTHVWQYQKIGPAYMVDSLCDQLKKGKKAYKVTDSVLNKKWNNIGKEQQAEIVANYWDFTYGPNKNLTEAKKYEAHARRVYKK